MPALHAKIKRGIVDYPHWLSVGQYTSSMVSQGANCAPDCKHILSRMLVVNPAHRAPLSEVLRHAWILRGYPGPPEAHLLHRDPLRISEIDPTVINGMVGFEFGTPAEIEKKLRDVLESDTYKRMVEIRERKQDTTNSAHLTNGDSPSSSLTAINHTGNSAAPGESPTSTRKTSKRFSGLGLDFYRRKLFPQGNPPPTTQTGKLPLATLYGPQTTAVMENSRPGEYIDPCFGFHPLISIYFLVREKIEREAVYGPQFASSQLDLNPPQPIGPSRVEDAATPKVASPAAPPSAFRPGTPQSVSATLFPPPQAAGRRPDYDMPLPQIPSPEPSHQAGTSYDSPVPKSPTVPTRPQARTIATDLPVTVPRNQDDPASPPSAYTGMPATPKPVEKHQHRRSTSLTNRAGMLATWAGNKVSSTVPRTAGPEQTTFDEKVEVEPRRSEQHVREEGRTSPHSTSAPATTVRRITTLLGNRLSEDSRKTLGRRGSLLRGAFSLPRHSVDVTSREGEKEGQPPIAAVSTRPKSQDEISTPVEPATAPVSSSRSQPTNNLHRRAATIVDSQSRESKHVRRGSLGAGFALGFGGTLGRWPRTANSAAKGKSPEVKEDEEAEEKPGDSEGEGVLVNREETTVEATEDDGSATERDSKPLYLKGLFRLASLF
jgi:hypothetical protein